MKDKIWGTMIFFTALFIAINLKIYLIFSIIIFLLCICEISENFQKAGGIWSSAAIVHSAGILLMTISMPENHLLFIMGVVIVNDAMAFVGGKYLNFSIFEKKIFPKTSPNKTWGGFLWGISGGMVFAFIFNSHLPMAPNVIFLMILTIFIESMAVFGDFLGSFIKRRAEIKDSGEGMFTGKWLLPGHGGVYDRFDAMAFTFGGVFLMRGVFGLLF